MLPAGADGSASAYPAVTLELTRSYTSYAAGPAGTPVQDAAFSKRLSWSASQVKADYEAALAAGAGPADPLAHTFVFEDLPRYAPNGSAYAYTVTEVRDELGGFETWADAGDLDWGTIADPTNAGASVSGLAPEAAADGQAPRVQATLANHRQQTPPTIELTGRKIWQDYDDAFGYRPDELVLSVSRRANSQSGMDNAIAPQRLTAGRTMTSATTRRARKTPGRIRSRACMARGSSSTRPTACRGSISSRKRPCPSPTPSRRRAAAWSAARICKAAAR